MDYDDPFYYKMCTEKNIVYAPVKGIKGLSKGTWPITAYPQEVSQKSDNQ